MARPSESDVTDRARAEALDWDGLKRLWREVKDGEAAGWSSGKALEHLIVRAFTLSGLPAEYPYDVPPGGNPVEQIDGMVVMGDTVFLIECKDMQSVDIEAVAKLHGQLLRRPPGTLGCVFSSGGFSNPALLLSDLAVPYRITLWSKVDIDAAIENEDFAEPLRRKYLDLCQFGLSDYSPFYKALRVAE